MVINADGPGDHKAITMEMLVQHYRETELIDSGDEGKPIRPGIGTTVV